MHTNTPTAVSALLLASFAANTASAQTARDLGDLSLQQLLQVEVTSTASRFPQPVTQAPASITIVTADEIRRLGHRTLSDVLRSVRGLYVSYDRNYSYLGVRGFSRPGDYNTRMLLLIDGHRLNDPIYDMGPIGTDLPLDVEMIDRVEIIRGPGSALYGTSAFFAVVNIITKTGWQEPGIRVQVEGGNLETYRGRIAAAHIFRNGANVILSASLHDIDGAESLYYPEFDTPDTAHGRVSEADDDEARRVYAALSFGGFTVRGALAERTKRVPTAAFGSVFGDPRLLTTDVYGIADLSYAGGLGGGWSGSVRAAYDRYHYAGNYPSDYGDMGVQVYADSARADWVSGELTASRRVATKHFFTAGFEARYPFRQEQYAEDVLGSYPIDSRRSGQVATYLQDEWTLTRQLVFSAGIRLDRAASWDTELTPRTALVYSPRTGTSLKLMHGRAFRAPNAYELHYYASRMGVAFFDLTPEQIRTTEAVWEQYYGGRIRSTVSVFSSDISHLISQTTTPDDPSRLMFANLPGAHADGIEAEIEARWPGGLLTRVSHAMTSADQAESNESLTNSPDHLGKLSLIVPVGGSRAFVGLESLYMSARRSVRGPDLDGFFLQNATLTTERLIPRVNLSFSVQNVFNQQYADPGAEEHVQAGIPQDGRTFRIGVGLRF